MEEVVRELSSVITRKGQTTIPIAVRRALGLQEGDRVIFDLSDDRVHIRRSDSIVARTAGLLRSPRPALTADGLREAGEQAIADDVVERAP